MTDPTTARKSKTSVFFDDLIRPVRSTVGVRMLKKMGWREGQGVGPKIKRKLRKLKAKKVHGNSILASSSIFLKIILCV